MTPEPQSATLTWLTTLPARFSSNSQTHDGVRHLPVTRRQPEQRDRELARRAAPVASEPSCLFAKRYCSPRVSGSGSRLSSRAFTATSRLEPDMESAAISGRKTRPSGWKTPAAIGRAMLL